MGLKDKITDYRNRIMEGRKESSLQEVDTGTGERDMGVQENKNPAIEVADSYPNKPENLSTDEYKHLLRYYPEETITRHYNREFTPSGEGFFSKIFSDNIGKPKGLDERKIRNAKAIAHLADAFGLVSQMVSSNGAHIRNRDYGSSAGAQVGKEERDLRKLYRDKMDKYNYQLLDTRLKDFQHEYARHQDVNKTIQALLSNRDKQEYDREKFSQQTALKREAENWNRAYKLMQEENREKQREKDYKIKAGSLAERQRKNDADIQYKKEAAVRRVNRGGKSSYEMRIDADQDDGEAKLDEFNNRIVTIDLTPEQVDQYAQKFKSDPEMMEKYSYLIKSGDFFGSRSFESKDHLARAYIQEMYNRKWEAKREEAERERQEEAQREEESKRERVRQWKEEQQRKKEEAERKRQEEEERKKAERNPSGVWYGDEELDALIGGSLN